MINLDRHACKTGNSLEVYKDGTMIARASWALKANGKRGINVNYIHPDYENNPAIIAKCDKVIERNARGAIVDNFRSLKANLPARDGDGDRSRALVSWGQAFGWLTHA